MSTIFHLDLDAFFVSVERILDPSLEGKPVIVGGDPHGRGVVSACSYEARKYGLHSAMPIRQAYRLCPHGIYLHGTHGEYGRYSELVKDVLEPYAPVLEQASVDEFYMDFTGCGHLYGSFFQLATKLQGEIWEKLSLPSSIGIGSHKTIAKICSDFHKPKGITIVPEGMEKAFLAPMPVEVIPGVGRKFKPVLNSKGFYRVGDVAAAPLDYFAAAFGKAGIDLWQKANGQGKTMLTVERERKSISKEHTYKEDVMLQETVENTLFELTGKVCQTLRDKEQKAATITLKLRHSDFVTITRSVTVKPTCDDKTVYEISLKAFRKALNRRVAVRLIGVGVSKFSEYSEQEELFDFPEIRREKLLNAVTRLRMKYGYGVVDMGTVSGEGLA